ncbi:MAG: hypothetical protein HOP19_13330 [Acidobacteria bacterium]|nr:hypothetical protein [Acidobacteriota bacterium]
MIAQDDIIAYDQVVTYDLAVLKLPVTPVDAAGTLSGGLTLTTNTAMAGQLTVSAFGVNSIVGTGTLLNLKLDVIGAAGMSSVLKIQKLVLNDDAQTNLTDGKVTIPPVCPTVTGIAPSSGAVGSVVTITGTNLSNVTSVKFSNNVTATITGNTATQVTVMVPAGAVNGPITVSKTGCTDVQTPVFTVGCTGVTITVNPATLAAATLNQAPNVTFTATGGTGPYQFTLSAGNLPNGLTLPTSGVMTGAPTVAGTFNFTVRARDANNCEGTRA